MAKLISKNPLMVNGERLTSSFSVPKIVVLNGGTSSLTVNLGFEDYSGLLSASFCTPTAV